MDLLGYLRQKGGNEGYSHRESALKTQGWHAPSLLLGRVPAPINRFLFIRFLFIFVKFLSWVDPLSVKE
jgi:hypothetical protein